MSKSNKPKHILTTGEKLAQKKTKYIVILAILLCVSVGLNVVLLFDINIPFIDIKQNINVTEKSIDDIFNISSDNSGNKKIKIDTNDLQNELMKYYDRAEKVSIDKSLRPKAVRIYNGKETWTFNFYTNAAIVYNADYDEFNISLNEFDGLLDLLQDNNNVYRLLDRSLFVDLNGRVLDSFKPDMYLEYGLTMSADDNLMLYPLANWSDIIDYCRQLDEKHVIK